MTDLLIVSRLWVVLSALCSTMLDLDDTRVDTRMPLYTNVVS